MMNTVFVIIMMWQTYSGDHENQGKDNHDGTTMMIMIIPYDNDDGDDDSENG